MLIFIVTLQVCANPMLSYLDDTELGAGKTSIFGMIFNIIVWIGLFYYIWVKPWKDKRKAKKDFTALVKHLYHANKELGECFERSITFKSFKNDTLTWSSHAKEGDKKILIAHWELINKTVKYIFGTQTKIVNILKNR